MPVYTVPPRNIRIHTTKLLAILINVQTTNGFHSLSKFLDEKKKYKYYTCRFKNVNDITAVIINMPTSITDSDVTKVFRTPRTIGHKTNKQRQRTYPSNGNTPF